MAEDSKPVTLIVGATSKWQADGRNTKLAHGQELDILVTYPVNQWLSVLGGYSKLWGGDVFATTPNSDVDFAYLQLQIKY